MPDSNDGDVGVFPFMKREVAKLGGGHDARRDRHVCEGGVDARDAESVQEHPRSRHAQLEVGGHKRRQELLRRVHDQGRVRHVGGGVFRGVFWGVFCSLNEIPPTSAYLGGLINTPMSLDPNFG